MEYPLGQFGSARCVPSQDFPISSHQVGGGMLERQLWCCANTVDCSQGTGWNQHAPLDHKHICVCVVSLSRCPGVSQSHQATNSSYFCSQSKSELFPFCQPYLPVGYFSVLQWHRVWTSVSCPFRVTFSTPAVVSGHSAAAQVTLPLPCQFSIAAATCAGHQPRSRSQYRPRTWATFLVLVGCLSLLHIHFTSAHSLHLPSLLAVSTTCQGAFLWKHNKNTENIKKMSCLMGLKLSLGKQWKTIP